jgi:hypothetical protein
MIAASGGAAYPGQAQLLPAKAQQRAATVSQLQPNPDVSSFGAF